MKKRGENSLKRKGKWKMDLRKSVGRLDRETRKGGIMEKNEIEE